MDDPELARFVEQMEQSARLEKMKSALKKKGDARIDIELVYGAPFTEIIKIINVISLLLPDGILRQHGGYSPPIPIILLH